MKILQLCIFSIMFFTMNLAMAGDFSEGKNKNFQCEGYKSFLRNEKCNELHKSLNLADQEIAYRKRKIDRLTEPDKDAIGLFVLGLCAVCVVQPIGFALIGMSGLVGINNKIKKLRIVWHNNCIHSMTEIRSSLMRECEAEECSEL